MQLGTRWSFGEAPPPRLPAPMVEAIRAVESEVEEAGTANWAWTLTWLEGRPVVELDTWTDAVDWTGTVIRLRSDGSVTTTQATNTAGADTEGAE